MTTITTWLLTTLAWLADALAKLGVDVSDARTRLALGMLLLGALLPVAGAVVAWCALNRAARRARILVRRMQAKVRDEHVLDLDPAFVAEMDAACSGLGGEESKTGTGACRVMSLSSYLGSLDYERDAVTTKRIAATLLDALGGKHMLAVTALVPALPGLVQPGVFARFSLTEFPSVLLAGAIIDSSAHLLAGQADPAESVIKGPPPIDSIDLLWMGEPPTVKPSLPIPKPANPAPPTTPDPLRINLQAYMRSLRTEMDLGPEPDKLHFAVPKPVSPELLPGLCIGNGGLTPGATPFQDARNRALTLVFNRVAANLLGMAGVCPRNNPNQPYSQVEVEVVPGVVVRSVGDLVDALVRHGGKKARLHTQIRTNLTAFGLAACVVDDAAQLPKEATTTDESVRLKYTQIPFCFCARTGVVSPNGGEPVLQLSSHSSIEFHFDENELLGDEGGRVSVTFYTGVEGFTGFHPGTEWIRPWVRRSDVREQLSVAEAIRAANLCAAEAAATNYCVRVWAFPFGGYGGLGVCNDSVAAVERVLKSRTRIFPLMMRGDAKSALIAVVYQELAPRLETVAESAREAGNEAIARVAERAVRDLYDFGQGLALLPNDLQVETHNVIDACNRIENMVFKASPFHADRQTRKSLPEVRRMWHEVIREFERRGASFANVADPSFHARPGGVSAHMRRAESKWGLSDMSS